MGIVTRTYKKKENNPMSKLTQDQEALRNQEYNEYVKEVTPTHNLWANMAKAFGLGGAICLLGQIFLNIGVNRFGLDRETAGLWCSLLLVLLSVILTSCNLYGRLANWGGAGALVPITGFANGVCASAVEFQKEGQVFGIGCQIFKIAGPVILYGIFSSWVLGLIYWILGLIL
jgi:stage V sporulation protein AC